MPMPSSLAICPPPLGRRYAVDDRQLLLHRSGEGGPAVVFLPGAGLVGLDYLNLHTEISRFTTSVIYDRAGTGWSDEIALPRTAAAVAEELRSLLRAAQIPPPYVLVATSLGGAYARRFAQLFPGETAGLVLLDPAHEGYASMPRQSLLAQLRMGLAMVPAALDMRRFYRPMFERMLASWPDGLRQTLIAYHLGAWRKSLQEARDLESEVFAEIASGGALPDIPLIVLTAMGIDPFQAVFLPEPYLRDLNARKRVFYDDFAASARRGENRLVDAGHSTLHTDRPDAVLAAIRDMIGMASQASIRPGPIRAQSVSTVPG
jgi:pimeloyl-ACP methyl ester carboxylesterase